MAQLKIGRECQSLSHSNVAPRLEHHHRDGASRQSVSNNQFCDHIETYLLIRNSLDHANGDDVDECDDL